MYKVKTKKDLIYIADELTKEDWKNLSKTIDVNILDEELFDRFKNELCLTEIIFKNRTMTTEFCHKYKEIFGIEGWYKDGKLHRDNDLPALKPIENNKDGSTCWYQNEKLHRENGPAVINNIGEFYYIYDMWKTKDEYYDPK